LLFLIFKGKVKMLQFSPSHSTRTSLVNPAGGDPSLRHSDQWEARISRLRRPMKSQDLQACT
jgi:hypothetical protein